MNFSTIVVGQSLQTIGICLRQGAIRVKSTKCQAINMLRKSGMQKNHEADRFNRFHLNTYKFLTIAACVTLSCMSYDAVAESCDQLTADLTATGQSVYDAEHTARAYCLTTDPSGYYCGSEEPYTIENQQLNNITQLRNRYDYVGPPASGSVPLVLYTAWESCGACPAGSVAQTNKTCAPAKDPANSCNNTNLPINTSTGNKYWNDIDYRAVGLGGINFSRYYNSQNTAIISTLGTAWRHAYDSSITTGFTINGVPAVLMARANGKAYSFAVNGTTYTSQDGDITDTLVGITDSGNNLTGYVYTVAADSSIETYDAHGKLVLIKDRTGLTQTLTYSNASTSGNIASRQGLLIRVADAFGRQLNFTYDTINRIATMTDSSGGQYQYAYDVNNNLASVTYPDGKTKTYLYNEQSFTGGTNLPNALTGIVDENGIRYASYNYNAQGQAYLEFLAGTVNQHLISYSTDGSSSTVTDPLGTVRTINFTTILGVRKATGQSQPGGAGCSPSSNATTYDTNGNVASRSDFNGNKTTYTFDLSRNLETSRTEASGTAQARTITTSWHPTYRLPAVIAEPLRKTTFTYDGSGNLLNKTVQATTDTTGSQGLSAQTTGTPRIWSYTYNQFGQVLTATGPRTDTVDKTTYAYDSTTGNLLTITNAAGQVTTLSNYDANGRVGTITDANGLTTNLTYYPRGWLKSKVVSTAGSSQTTSYSYDGVGQLKNVTLPDNSTITYTYDDAHRLTDIADSLNNRIHYTLDNMGNRISEQVNDPGNVLTRQTTRIYDALNRLQQVTGAPQ